MRKLSKKRILTAAMAFILGFTLCGCSLQSNTNKENTGNEPIIEDGKIAIYDIETPDLPGDIYKCTRSGTVFTIPDGYEVTDKNEYYILSKDSENGCLLFFCNSDCGLLGDGTETFNAYRELYDRVSVILNGIEQEITTVDGSNSTVTQETIADRDTKIYTGDVYVSSQIYPGTYYCQVLDYKPLSIVQIGETSADPKEVLTNTASLKYAGDPITDHPQNQLAMTKIEYEGHTMSVPAAWEVIEGYDDCLIVRSPAMIKDNLSDCRIVFYKSGTGFDEWYSPTLTDMYESPLTNAQMQNPTINNYKKMTYVIDSATFETINDRSFAKTVLQTAVKSSTLKARSSLPSRNITVYHYATYSEDSDKAYCVAFCANYGKNRTEMQTLAEALIETFN